MYLPLEDYGLIGNLHTAALVGRNGAIDWLCWPRFDAPSLFAALLDDHRGGRFQIAPEAEGVVCRQVYWPETAVLITRFLGPDWAAELTDYMPVGTHPDQPGCRALVRRVEGLYGAAPLRLSCLPAFDYARARHRVHVGDGGAVFESEAGACGLAASVPLEAAEGAATARFTLRAGERAVFALEPLEEGRRLAPLTHAQEETLLRRTLAYWQRWIGQCTYVGRWRHEIHRAALTLKLLTYEPTGAIVAAPTTSLPETPGGTRNWDYRYTWIRDAAFTVYAFIRLGFTDEAAAFVGWLHDRCHAEGPNGPLRVLYGIDGEAELAETTLDHLEGYRGARPVRIGNAAHDQLQLDIYGALLDAVYLYNKHRSPISFAFWERLCGYVGWVCEHWERPDVGIWEFRGEPQHFTFSKMMCWVTLDRALRLADKRSFPADRARWLSCRDALYRRVMREGWSAERGAFAQALGSTALDASVLLMPLVFFTSPTDPRMLRTIDTLRQAPEQGGLSLDGMMYRYLPEATADPIGEPEGTFTMCSLWLVEALTRAGRTQPDRLEQAQLLFEKIRSQAGPLGLYAEELSPQGAHWGNYPQAFTHLALISAAYNLNRTLEGEAYGQTA